MQSLCTKRLSCLLVYDSLHELFPVDAAYNVMFISTVVMKCLHMSNVDQRIK